MNQSSPSANMARRGVSLLELSLVMVLLGLLAGGILVGQSLMRAAELRSVMGQVTSFSQATQLFAEKFHEVPGDFSRATELWGRQAATADCVTLSAAALAARGVCDGNGNRVLEWGVAANQSSEIFQFWRHLALAGFIEGEYSGIAGAGSLSHSTISGNVPGAKIDGGGWIAESLGQFVGDARTYRTNYGNGFSFGAAVANDYPYEKILSAQDVWSIDDKLDDGKPATGKIIATYWNDQCAGADDGTSTVDDLVASYRLTDRSEPILCAFKVTNVF